MKGLLKDKKSGESEDDSIRLNFKSNKSCWQWVFVQQYKSLKVIFELKLNFVLFT